VLVKICGLTRREDAEAAVEAGADLLGFVFVPGTPRFVDPATALWVRDLDDAERVGVFRDQPLAHILAVRDRLGLDRVQLHGGEPDGWLDILGPATIRRVRPEGDDPWRRAAMLAGRALPLLDPGAGDGAPFDWSSLGPPPAGLGFAIAGGLTAEGVAAAIRTLRPLVVDVSSGVESAPGVKDPRRVAAFVAAATRAAVDFTAVDEP
jgi:phosphoribosylanthranilate isomerase